MAMAVGCKADQLLYALPTQGDEVAEIGQQLGLATVLAIGQILDQTSARMRVSMHGRTLVEMAVVRICQLGELDDLASAGRGIARLTGRTTESPSVPGGRAAASRQCAAKQLPTRAATPQKKTLSRPPRDRLSQRFGQRSCGSHCDIGATRSLRLRFKTKSSRRLRWNRQRPSASDWRCRRTTAATLTQTVTDDRRQRNLPDRVCWRAGFW